ncbi:hypothetical protein HanIR_Chr15g0778921 [Helianthus annuus]|nr:hypothetical protein HanIR_Chr15g0778921 [Helianthus annuus]
MKNLTSWFRFPAFIGFYFIPNFSSLSSCFLQRAISIFKRLLIGLLRYSLYDFVFLV